MRRGGVRERQAAPKEEEKGKERSFGKEALKGCQISGGVSGRKRQQLAWTLSPYSREYKSS